MKFKGLLALSFIPLILIGCSSGITPSFDDSSNVVDSSQTSPPTMEESSDSKNNSKGSQEQNEDKGKSSQSDAEKQPNSENIGVYELSEEEKKNGMKLDENGNPYFAGKSSEKNIVSNETEDTGDKGDPNVKNTSIYDPKASDFNTAVTNGNRYIKNIKAKKWKQACKDVYEVDGRDCASHLEFVYKSGNTFVEYKKDKINGVMVSKKSMVVSLKDKGYEDNQRMTFIKQDGAWKIFIK